MRFEPGAVVITLVDVKIGLGWGGGGSFQQKTSMERGRDWDLSVLCTRLPCYRRFHMAT